MRHLEPGIPAPLTDLRQRLQAVLADRYAIERELGHGGMATVYLAQDLKHDRPVAVKVLRPELAAALGTDRFLREIKLAARLTHPHILPLHDSGEADGFLYYVMPYVEGESLRDRLAREKQLPVAEAVEIAREVADALSYAHSHDVVHRDIKPENILFESGHAVVSDPLERPYLDLADVYALAGRPERAGAVIAEFEQSVAADLRRFDEPFRQGVLGEVALARRNYREAIPALREAAEGVCDLCSLPLLGRAYELAGETDSALAVYERYVTTPDMFRLIGPGPIIGPDAYFLAGTYERLGELYEARGERAKAADYYGRFVRLWKDADAELQPRVVEARRRLARLGGEQTR